MEGGREGKQVWREIARKCSWWKSDPVQVSFLFNFSHNSPVALSSSRAAQSHLQAPQSWFVCNGSLAHVFAFALCYPVDVSVVELRSTKKATNASTLPNLFPLCPVFVGSPFPACCFFFFFFFSPLENAYLFSLCVQERPQKCIILL